VGLARLVKLAKLAYLTNITFNGHIKYQESTKYSKKNISHLMMIKLGAKNIVLKSPKYVKDNKVSILDSA
jgi:hypothetical protein